MAEATPNNTNKPATPAVKHMNPIIVGTFAFLITVVISGTILIITFKEPSKTVTQTIVVKEAASEEIGPLVPLGNEIIVNLPSELEGEGEHYLKVNVTLEVDNEKVTEEVTKRVPQIRDLLISILRSKTKEKIDEKEGKDLVRSEIINSINSFLVLGKVKNVFFEDFVIQ